MSDNTEQYEWIVTIKGNLDILFLDRPDVFVAGDLLWYPVEGDPKIRMAPDTMVAIGRPKGYRGSYKQWEQGGLAPQVVFEVLSPGNRLGAMVEKLEFYRKYGVDEYYLYDPDTFELDGWIRDGENLVPISEMDGWVSSLLGIQFNSSQGVLRLFGPDGRRFLTYAELAEERDHLTEERDRIARQVAMEKERADRLAAQLRALGIEPS